MVEIVYVVTHDPNVPCGVADYTERLAKAMNDAGARAEVVKLPTWSFSEAIRIIKRYSAPGTVFHIQYPSLGMGASPAAALFPLIAHGHATFFTLHEFTLFNPVRKAYFLPFALTSDHVIFTNEPEQCHYARFFPFARDDGIVLPIGSNFDSSGDSPTQGRRLVYFGQIAPGKGIEEFLDAVRTLRARRCNIPAQSSALRSLRTPRSRVEWLRKRRRSISRACPIYRETKCPLSLLSQASRSCPSPTASAINAAQRSPVWLPASAS